MKTLSANIPAPPSYFFHDAALNKSGDLHVFDDLLVKLNKGLPAEEFEKLVAKGTVVIDARQEIPNGIMKGAYWISSKAPLCQFIAHVLDPK